MGAAPYRAVTIPAVLAGKSVDAVAERAFANDNSLRIVTITGSAAGTAVGAEAFANCISLEHVVLGNVVSIGEKAFANCAIRDVFIPASVASIGADAFDGVSVVYGMTAAAENHAASIGAEYVDVSKAKTSLEIQSLPVKTSYEAGENLDLTGLVLTSNGAPVSLEDCYVEKLPTRGGTHALTIQYLDASVTIDVTVAAAPHNHVWSALWTTTDTHHWHECTAADCPVTADAEKDGYGAHRFANYVSDNNATCLEDGTKTASCADGCGEKDTIADPGTALDHFFIDYVSDGNATCTADGTKTAICVSGDATDTIPDPGSKKPHSFTNYVSDNNATCLLDGTKTAQCDNCTAKDTVNEPGTARNHSFTNYVPDGNATCLTDGTKTAKCDRCTETNTLPDSGSALNHSFTNYVPDGNAGCLTDGTKTAKCDRCTVTDTKPDEYSALNHRFTNYVSDGNAWCEKDGTKTAKCDHCDATDTVADAGSALNHTYTDDADASCNRCEHIRDLAQPEHVHKWSEQWVHTDTHHWHECTAAGCTVTANSEKNGYRTHTYSGSFDTTCECGYVRGVVRIVKMPTAAAAGYVANMTLAEIVLNDGKVTDVNAVPLAGTWAWAAPDTKVYAGVSGHTAVFRPTDTRFPEVRVEVEVTVSTAAQTLSSIHGSPDQICTFYAGPGLEMRDMVSSNMNVAPVFVITEDEGEAYVEGTVLYSPDAGFVTVEAQFPGVDVNGDGTHEYAPGSVEIHTKFTTVPMFRMYDKNGGEHFYTGSEVERDNLMAAGWEYEGVGFNYPAIGAPVYRLYDDEGSGDHLYTMNQAEIDRLVAQGWNNEGVAFNSAADTEVAQYRLYNPNAHPNGTRGAWHFTSDEGERAMLIAAGWQDQGIGWYSTRK